ncbi:hypothetical protein FQN54_000106 [Arachnomyces sp. PD_36]|nr:hypothetical protein FQN54_000106 [Arachnomyces sp. PD_36]
MAMQDTSTQVDSRSLRSNVAGTSVPTTRSEGPSPVPNNEAANPVPSDGENAPGDDGIGASSYSPPRAESLVERVSGNGSARSDQNETPTPVLNDEENAAGDDSIRTSPHSAPRAESSAGRVSGNSSTRSSQQRSSSEESTVSRKAILVAGCSSQGLRNVYLLSLSYHKSSETQSQPSSQLNPSFFADVANTSSSASLEVRVGYFGLCASLEGQGWTCATDSNSLTENLNATHDPLNLIWVADRFQNQVFLSALIIISAVLTLVEFGLLASFPGWHEEADEDGSIREVKPFPAKSVTHLCIGFSALISLFLIVAILWQHVAAVAQSSTVQAIFDGSVKTQVGTAAMAFGWVAVGLNFLNTVSLWVMIASLNVLTALTDA